MKLGKVEGENHTRNATNTQYFILLCSPFGNVEMSNVDISAIPGVHIKYVKYLTYLVNYGLTNLHLKLSFVT